MGTFENKLNTLATTIVNKAGGSGKKTLSQLTTIVNDELAGPKRKTTTNSYHNANVSYSIDTSSSSTYYLTFSTTKTFNSTTYYVVGTISGVTNVYYYSGEKVTPDTVFSETYVVFYYTSSSSSTSTTALNNYLYFCLESSTNTLYLLSTTSACFRRCCYICLPNPIYIESSGSIAFVVATKSYSYVTTYKYINNNENYSYESIPLVFPSTYDSTKKYTAIYYIESSSNSSSKTVTLSSTEVTPS